MSRALALAVLIGALSLTVSAQVTCNAFELDASAQGDVLKLSIATDLPDATRLAVEINRRYWRDGQRGVFTLDYVATEMSAGEVKAGVQVDISEAAMKKALEKVNLAAEAGGRPPVKVKELDGRFKVKVMTTMSQPDKSFGEFNKKLVGTAVIQDAEYRGARRIRWVDLSGKTEETVRNAKTPSSVKARDFEAGKCYVLRRKVDIRSSRGPRGEMHQVSAPESGVVYIDQREEDGDWVWFRVAVAVAPDREPMCFGWVRHDAFDVKKHRETEAPGFLEKLGATGFLSEGYEEKRWTALPKLALEETPDGASIVRATVVLDDGLNEAEAAIQARMAAWSFFEGNDAALIKLQRAGDTEPRAGEVWILPAALKLPEALSGIELSSVAPGDRKTTVRLDPRYFLPRPKALAIDRQVILKTEGSFEVVLWADPATLSGEKNARIAASSVGRIVGVRYLETAEGIILRYEVKDESGRQGWVAAETVTPL